MWKVESGSYLGSTAAKREPCPGVSGKPVWLEESRGDQGGIWGPCHVGPPNLLLLLWVKWEIAEEF